MTEPTESIQQLKARIQRQLLESIADWSKVKLQTQESLGLLINMIHAYETFMSAPTVTFAPNGVEGEAS